MRIKTLALMTIITLAALLTGCESEADYIQRKADVVKACKDNGGEWYNTPGWGESCHFDTRSKP